MKSTVTDHRCPYKGHFSFFKYLLILGALLEPISDNYRLALWLASRNFNQIDKITGETKLPGIALPCPCDLLSGSITWVCDYSRL